MCTLCKSISACRSRHVDGSRHHEFQAVEHGIKAVMDQLCEGCVELDNKRDWNPTDANSAKLLQQSIDLLERALWEKFGGAERW
eukprot:scaffold61429_cov21-Tisochrysis_lutea.AAC.3